MPVDKSSSKGRKNTSKIASFLNWIPAILDKDWKERRYSWDRWIRNSSRFLCVSAKNDLRIRTRSHFAARNPHFRFLAFSPVCFYSSRWSKLPGDFFVSQCLCFFFSYHFYIHTFLFYSVLLSSQSQMMCSIFPECPTIIEGVQGSGFLEIAGAAPEIRIIVLKASTYWNRALLFVRIPVIRFTLLQNT